MIHRFRLTRHLSIRTRLALGSFVPLALATVALGLSWFPQPGSGSAYMLLSGALMLSAFGCCLVLLHRNTHALARPLEEAREVTRALALGQYDRRVRVKQLDETGRLLVALEELGDYLAVVLPEEERTPHRNTRPASVSGESLERIAEQLREGGESLTGSVNQPDRSDLPSTPDAVARPIAQATSGPRLRLVQGQA